MLSDLRSEKSDAILQILPVAKPRSVSAKDGLRITALKTTR